VAVAQKVEEEALAVLPLTLKASVPNMVVVVAEQVGV
jgi:hypothetical protein|tara:strand:- start:1019 stop:1129 length:111 start_codon:yes stop_codon:yes gene_type:complete